MAEPRVDAAFAALLQARRESLNARYRQARASLPRLDPERVFAFLTETLAPIAAALPPDQAGSVTERLYGLALPLLGRDLLGPGARQPHIQAGWERLLPLWPRLLTEAPDGLARAISNALHALGRQPGARPEDWLQAMAALGGQAESPDELLALGQVLAWRSGMAQYRDGALTVAARMRPALAGPALGAPKLADADARDGLVQRLRAHPWADPNGAEPANAAPRVRILTVAGSFRGLGGPFVAPPTVTSVGSDLVASDPEGRYLLRADRYGTVFVRTPPPASARSARPTRSSASTLRAPGGGSGVTLSAKGEIAWGEAPKARFPELAGATSAAFDGQLLAVTQPLAHGVFLLTIEP